MKLKHIKTKIEDYYRDSKGRFQGEFKWWWNNGKLRIYCFYKNNELEGEYKQWYTNGQLAEHCYYNNGKKVTKEEFLKLKIEKILK